MTNKEELIHLAKFALFHLEIDFGIFLFLLSFLRYYNFIFFFIKLAIRVYRLVGFPEMVFALNTIKVLFIFTIYFSIYHKFILSICL